MIVKVAIAVAAVGLLFWALFVGPQAALPGYSWPERLAAWFRRSTHRGSQVGARFFRKGASKLRFLVTIAAPVAVTTQTTAIVAGAAATVPVVDTTGFATAGYADHSGGRFTYTGKTGASLTGCAGTPAMASGDAVIYPGGVTAAELAAGTDLSDWETIRGFVINNTPIATPDGASPFTKSIPGADATAESGFRFYDDDDSTAKRTALAKGTVGWVILMPYGSAAGKRAEVWRARSTGYNDVYESGNEAAKADVSFAIEEVPNQSGVVLS